MSSQAIASHALLSDSHTAALVDANGSVEWWCAPSFDSPSVFGRLLDPEAGHFSVSPREVEEVERRYRDSSLVLETTWTTGTGRAQFVEALATGAGERGHELGVSAPHVLLRQLSCLDGTVVVDVEFSPRFEYGLTTPLLLEADGHIIARGGPMTIKLSTNAELEVRGSRARTAIELEAGQTLSFAAEAGSSWQALPRSWTPEMINDRLEDTEAGWRSWGEEHQNYVGPYADLVTHSGRVLQGLTFRPTGAMVAAATTSLPEVIGGQRNWDYRYCWIRDASFTLRALWVAACPDEAGIYLDYLNAAASSIYERGIMQIMFGIDGRRDLTERELDWLKGWRESSPVRVGNAAWRQPQHDIYGELLSSVHRLKDQVGQLDENEKRFLTFLADRATEIWREPDHGIWEIRGDPDHYVHSKLMCWVAVDRAIDLAEDLDAADRLAEWEAARQEIKDEILDRGWSEEVGAFTQTYDSSELDASSLVLPLVGFLPHDDKRVLSTIDAVMDRLIDERGLVWRYRVDDGLDGEEGSFLLCTFWLAEALAGAGRVAEARDVFERAISYRNDVDLLAEEIDTATGEMVGNFPQAFSHVGLINAAWAIKQGEETD